MAEGSSSATVASKSMPAWMRAPARLYSWTRFLSPPSRNDAPNTNSVLVTMRAGDGRLHQHVLPCAQGRERDDQLGQVPQRGVEQPPHRIAGLGGHRLGGVAQQPRQGHDGQHGQDEQQHARFGPEPFPPRTPRERRSATRGADCDGFHETAASWSYPPERSANMARASMPPERFLALKPFCSRIRVA